VQNKLDLLLKIILQNTWTLQLFTINIIDSNGNILTKDKWESPGSIKLGLTGEHILKTN
jgi:hypothetical protein